MRKLLRKKPDSAPENRVEAQPQHPATKVTGIGEHQTPLYARFASSQSTATTSGPIISGPAPLSARSDLGSRAASGRNEAAHRQSYTRQTSAPASRSQKFEKPLPVADFREDKPLPTPVPQEQPPESESDIPIFDDINYGAQEQTKQAQDFSWDAVPQTTSTKRHSDTLPLNGNPFIPSPTSIPRPTASTYQRYEAPAETRPRVMESRSASGSGKSDMTSDSFNRGTSRKRFSPMAAFGLGSAQEPPKVATKGSRSSLQSNGARTSITTQNTGNVESSSPITPRQSLQYEMPARRRTPPQLETPDFRKSNSYKEFDGNNFDQRYTSPKESSIPLTFPSQQRSPAGPRRESLPVTLKEPPDPRARRDSSGRSRVPAPFGPRASISNGPSSLVQGQPRIFAPMASPEPEPREFLKPGQPRIFAVANPDFSPPSSPAPPLEYSRYPSPPLATPPSSQTTYPELAFAAEAIHKGSPIPSTPLDSYSTSNPHRRGTSDRYNPSRSPPNVSASEEANKRSNHPWQRQTEHSLSGNGNRTSPPQDIKGKGPEVLRKPFSPDAQKPRLSSVESPSGPRGTEIGYVSSASPTPRHPHLTGSAEDDYSAFHRDLKGKGHEAPRRPLRSTTPEVVHNTHSDEFQRSTSMSGTMGNSEASYGSQPAEPPTPPENPHLYEQDLRQNGHHREVEELFDLDNSRVQKPRYPFGNRISNSRDYDIDERTQPNAPSKLQDDWPDTDEDEIPAPKYYPLQEHLSEPRLLGCLLQYLTFYEWTLLYMVNNKTRTKLAHTAELRDEVLESYLKTIGYIRWTWDAAEPLTLSLRDLSEYMRGVSIPTHEYARISEAYLQARSSRKDDRVVFTEQARTMSFATRAYSRVIIRLRLQAEAVARNSTKMDAVNNSARARSHLQQRNTNTSRSSSRAPSPNSNYSHNQANAPSRPSSLHQSAPVSSRDLFTSPIYRPRRAPLLRVFVPSPDEWLSDASVLECESELKRAGISHLLRPGDAVWDVAVGDEGNAGRMIWDGAYLLDLDYTYSKSGDLPRYLPSLAFSPSYFHRVIRINGNPIVHLDLAPWAEHISMNLKLLQDRVKTETSQGNHHTVVRWVHRSSFELHPPMNGKKIPIPFGNGNWTVDRGWYGTVVVEAEGTNEGLADLQDRCKGAFPARVSGRGQSSKAEERRKVFKILRERSKPGEIWIRTVSDKERILP